MLNSKQQYYDNRVYEQEWYVYKKYTQKGIDVPHKEQMKIKECRGAYIARGFGPLLTLRQRIENELADVCARLASEAKLQAKAKYLRRSVAEQRESDLRQQIALATTLKDRSL